MRRLLILPMLLAACSVAQASEARFDQVKALTLKALAERQHVLARELTCVQAAQELAKLKECSVSAKLEREAMGRTLRQEIQRYARPE